MKQFVYLLVAAAVLGGAACGSGDGAKKDPAQIRTMVSNVVGEAQIERDGDSLAASAGLELSAQDAIVTGPDSSVDLAIEGYGVVKVGSQSRVLVAKIQKDASGDSAELRVERGNVASFIQRQDESQEYQVTTPTAIAGVRGTAFMVGVDDSGENPRVNIAVLDGKVAVNMPGQAEVVLDRNTQIAIDGFQEITRDMIRPLSEDNLAAIKRLAVFQKSNIMEFNQLLEEAKASSPELQILEGDQTAEGAIDEREAESARRGGMDSVRQAERADISRTLKRDTRDDPIKLEPDSSYE